MTGVLPRPLRVAVIGGGQNCEHDVGVASAAAVSAALRSRGHQVLGLTIGRDGRWTPEHAQPCRTGSRAQGVAAAVTLMDGCDVVFPAVHGPYGEDGMLAALCELAGVPYVGSGVRSGAIAMDKWATKLVAQAVGIATAPAHLVTAGQPMPRWSGPVVVKPVAAGSSHGVSRVDDPAELADAVRAALAVDDRVLVEEVVLGREIDVAVLRQADGTVLAGPPLEIELCPDTVFDTGHKYDGSAQFVVPARLTHEDSTRLQQAAVEMFETLGCAGVARIDFFLSDGRLVLNEVNTMPGMTEQSQVRRMFAVAGLSYEDLIEHLVAAALAP